MYIVNYIEKGSAMEREREQALESATIVAEALIDLLAHCKEDAAEDKLGELAAHLMVVGYQSASLAGLLRPFRNDDDIKSFNTLVAWYQLQGNLPIPDPPHHTEN